MKESYLDLISRCNVITSMRKSEIESIDYYMQYVNKKKYRKHYRHILAIRGKASDIIDEQQHIKNEVIRLIEQHPHELGRIVLYKKYVEGKRIPKIAAELHYNESYLFKVIKNAEKKFDTVEQ